MCKIGSPLLSFLLCSLCTPLQAIHWSNKYHDLWYDVKPYLDALHRAPELVRGFLEKILAPKQEHTMNVPQQNRKRGQDMEL